MIELALCGAPGTFTAEEVCALTVVMEWMDDARPESP